jgi:hypothetical protein
MREFIKNKLRESFTKHITEVKNSGYEAYHGSPYKIKKFNDNFISGKDAIDQQGPGIYFTDSNEEAIGYAGENGYVYQVRLHPKKLLSSEPKNNLEFLTNTVIKLIKMSPNWKRVARSYDDDIETGLNDMVYSYIGQNQTEKDVFISIFNDIYQNNPIDYVRNMVKLGYDGIYLPTKSGGEHIVMYNPSLIEYINSKAVK